MADSKLEQSAEEFRNLIRQASERGQLAPAAPAIDPDALAAAVRTAVAEAMAEQAPQTAPLDPALIERLEAAVRDAAERTGDSDVLLHLRNVLPGQFRQDLQQHTQATQQRIAGLEQEIAALRAANGWGRDIARAVLTGIVVGVLLLFSVVFEKQVQDWGRDTLYPLFGVPIKEAMPSTPRQANPAAPQERR